jgi:hypothetical protein
MENAVARSLLYIRALKQSRDTERESHRLCVHDGQAQLHRLQALLDDKDKLIRRLSTVHPGARGAT